MQRLDVPAGSMIRLTATARADGGLHRWEIRLFGAGDPADATPRLSYGSKIGGDDRMQRIEVPAQAGEGWLEADCRHAAGDGWDDDRPFLDDSAPGVVAVGFSRPESAAHEVLLSFAFISRPLA
jgi:hypothetical protein